MTVKLNGTKGPGRVRPAVAVNSFEQRTLTIAVDVDGRAGGDR